MAEQLEINSWLVQNERSLHLKCPPGLNVSQEEYLNTLRTTAKELELPLQLETLDINWVDANLHQIRIQAKLNSKERFGLLTGLDYIGRVAFVEQKTYLDPFDPPVLEEPSYTAAAAVGIGGLILGVLMMVSGDGTAQCLGPLVLIAGVGIGIKLYQDAASAPKKKFDEALNKWVKDVIDLARKAEINSELKNTAQALDEAVKLAVDRLFTQRGAQMEADEKRRRTASEIQTELEQRKAEGFK